MGRLDRAWRHRQDARRAERRHAGPAGAPPAAGAPAPGGAVPASIVFSASDATFEQVLDLSATVPVIVEIIAPGLQSALGPVVESYGGRLALAVVDGSTSPQIAQAFQVREVPAVSAVVGGRELAYTVSCGTIVLREESEKTKGDDEGASEGEKPRAEVSVIAYTLDSVENRGDRPVTFAFNGGPGSSSIWLHLGLLGPRRVVMGDAGSLAPPPATLADNAETLLEHSDLVFIDPPHTGYSIAASEEARTKLLGVDGDVEALAEAEDQIAARVA